MMHCYKDHNNNNNDNGHNNCGSTYDDNGTTDHENVANEGENGNHEDKRHKMNRGVESPPSHDDIAVLRKEMRERPTSQLRYPGAARLTEEQELVMLSHSLQEASSSSSSSSSSCYTPPKSLPTMYGPEIYDFIELLHEVHVSYSAAFRDFSPG
jgi:hypothetical protein